MEPTLKPSIKAVTGAQASGGFDCRGKSIPLGERTIIMGILNVTPDSFSDGGQYNRLDKAVKRAVEMADEGADIIDVGGESTRPGSTPVPLEEELERVIPIVEAIRKEVDIPISVDTYKAEVARQALEAGAHMINDIWGFKKEPEMAGVAAQYDVPVVLMHNRTDMDYRDFLNDVIADLQASIRIAHEAGIPDHRIILDPGIGFAKQLEHNLVLMKNLHRITELGYPVLLGTSRKRFIRHTLNLPVEDVVEGTAATVVLGIAQGCGIVRVHDVKAIKRAAVMTDAIMRSRL
jgi:dihydropteroate synthase